MMKAMYAINALHTILYEYKEHKKSSVHGCELCFSMLCPFLPFTMSSVILILNHVMVGTVVTFQAVLKTLTENKLSGLLQDKPISEQTYITETTQPSCL